MTGSSGPGRTAAVVSVLMAGVLLSAAAQHPDRSEQPRLSTRNARIISVDGLRFRDLDGDGRLTRYEDWRLSPQRRAGDLLSRLSLQEKAGLLVHGNLPAAGTGYDAAQLAALIGQSHISTFITRLSATPAEVAKANNAVQEAAEKERFGIPVVISTDPRNGFSVTEGQTVARVGTTAIPDATGLAAARDPRLTRILSDIVRREYRAVGITEGLSPQADLATEPRWTRINGTFGSDPKTARNQVKAYVTGLQNGTSGLKRSSVATVTKHWAGYGAQVNGYDSHYYYGRYAAFPGNNFATHLVPYTGAFQAGTSGIMPTYSILKDLVLNGHKIPQVGAGFSSYLLQDLLRGRFGFDGVVVSDWGITGDCPQVCRETRPPASFVGSWGVGMPWGVEDVSILDRYALTINAGVDQVGGSNTPSYVVDAVKQGLIRTGRLNQAARRVLVQKFELGLFENPFVNVAAAGRISGNARFQAVGDAAQAKSLTLLTNHKRTLPARAKKVFAYGIPADRLKAHGLTAVTDPAQADLAIVRLSDPRGGPDLTDLGFTGREEDYRALKAATDAGVRTVAVPKLDRPLILTNVVDRADAVLANYGVSDDVLLETVLGERRPGGKLPFELPSSQKAVEKQLPDVPDDSKAPLFSRGHGLSFRAN